MKKLVLIIFIAALSFSCKEKTKENAEEVKSEVLAKVETETSAGEWVSLFDGASFKGWHEYGVEGISKQWKIEDGAMVYHLDQERVNGEHYNLVSDKEYTNFELSIDWRISEVGNSGVFWGIKELPELGHPYQSGPEIQVLDNDKHPDGKNGTNRLSGALYDMVSPSKDVTNPVGEWNNFIISVDHKTNQGSVVLNGEKVAEFPVNGDTWEAMVEGSKFKGSKHFGKYKTGKIGLQDHGNDVAFRNIKIKEL